MVIKVMHTDHHDNDDIDADDKEEEKEEWMHHAVVNLQKNHHHFQAKLNIFFNVEVSMNIFEKYLAIIWKWRGRKKP